MRLILHQRVSKGIELKPVVTFPVVNFPVFLFVRILAEKKKRLILHLIVSI